MDSPLPLTSDALLKILGVRLSEAARQQSNHASLEAAAWTLHVFGALAGAAETFGLRSCARYHAEGATVPEGWMRREHLFDITWFRHDCGKWDTPALILEHENKRTVEAFMFDFWKLLLGYAPLRVMIGYSLEAADRDGWIRTVNEALEDPSAIQLPGDVEDLILLGHRGMPPTGYAVYRREGRTYNCIHATALPPAA